MSAGMWALLTLNVEVLPRLSLELWQTVFAVVAVCGACEEDFAAVKAFEVMAWLLHEPRLLAKVPVFCILGVRPLLANQAAPTSVSEGAVHLLSHLHSRLEVLIKDDEGLEEGEVDPEEGDEGLEEGDVLWEVSTLVH